MAEKDVYKLKRKRSAPSFEIRNASGEALTQICVGGDGDVLIEAGLEYVVLEPGEIHLVIMALTEILELFEDSRACKDDD